MQACFAGIGERGFMIPETMDHLASIPGLHVCAECQRVLRTGFVGKSLHTRFAGIGEIRVVVLETLDHPALVVGPEVFASVEHRLRSGNLSLSYARTEAVTVGQSGTVAIDTLTGQATFKPIQFLQVSGGPSVQRATDQKRVRFRCAPRWSGWSWNFPALAIGG